VRVQHHHPTRGVIRGSALERVGLCEARGRNVIAIHHHLRAASRPIAHRWVKGVQSRLSVHLRCSNTRRAQMRRGVKLGWRAWCGFASVHRLRESLGIWAHLEGSLRRGGGQCVCCGVHVEEHCGEQRRIRRWVAVERFDFRRVGHPS
jgi:hypothetical protein